ncbi:type II toxin-antitoxin system RelE/ParE family toxin, partial [Klebsiella pneumoniae]
ANIDNRELAAFRELARHYPLLSEEKMAALVKRKELVEICHDCKN